MYDAIEYIVNRSDRVFIKQFRYLLISPFMIFHERFRGTETK